MTIAVGVACPEGLVLAAGSRSSVLTEEYFRVATDYSHKVFTIGDRFGVVTFGWRFLEGNTVAGVMEEFAAQTRLRGGIDELAPRLAEYYGTRIERHIRAGFDDPPPEGVDVLGFIVAGYDASGIGRLKKIYLPSGEIIEGAATAANETGAHWEGEIDVFIRLVSGYDAARVDVSQLPDEQREALENAGYIIPCFRMALQDAVDFAAFVIRTTIEMQRFSEGTLGAPGGFATCGGPIEILAVTSRGPEWVARTALRPGSTAVRAAHSMD